MMIFGVPLQTFLFALIGGVIPTVIWLRFWLREDDDKPEPPGLLILTFVAGMLSVLLVLPIENWIYSNFALTGPVITLIAFVEEFGKFAVVALVAFPSRYIDEANDYAVYLITGALGFAALENTLFLIEPLVQENLSIAFSTGNLRFLGATVLHVVASGLIGVSMGLAFYKSRQSKYMHFLVGIILATGLHAIFNFFIMRASPQNIITIFGVVWVAAIVILLLFEKLRHMERHAERPTQQPIAPQPYQRIN